MSFTLYFHLPGYYSLYRSTLLGWAAALEVGAQLREPGRPGLLLANEEQKLASFILGIAGMGGPIDGEGISVYFSTTFHLSSFLSFHSVAGFQSGGGNEARL